MASTVSPLALFIKGLWLCYLLNGRAQAESQFLTDPNVNLIDDPLNSAIDFSRALPGPDGMVCVERKKFVDTTEKDQLKECFVQNVTQCYFTYVTEYDDGFQEKCEDFYWKTCKIVFRERRFNATSRRCVRPLVKRCHDASSTVYGGQSGTSNQIVCQTFFQTECNTTHVLPDPSDEPLPVTFCEKIPRKICAPDNCRIEEGGERCEEHQEESSIEQPVELCDLQPQKHCAQVKVSVPKLIPERKCRLVEKEICNTRFVNAHDVRKPLFIKYCTRMENLLEPAAPTSSYLPPSSDPALPDDLLSVIRLSGKTPTAPGPGRHASAATSSSFPLPDRSKRQKQPEEELDLEELLEAVAHSSSNSRTSSQPRSGRSADSDLSSDWQPRTQQRR